MSEADPAQAINRHDPRRRCTDEREQLPTAGVEEQRFVGVDEVLVEREVRWLDVAREPVDLGGNFVYAGFHQNGTSVVSRPSPGARPERMRQNSTASSSYAGPPLPCVHVPPAGPVRVSSNGWPCRPAHSLTTLSTSTPSWSGVRTMSVPVARVVSTRCIQTSRVRTESMR